MGVEMRERWAEEFTAKATAYWTPERTQQVTQGR
jgi:hypothetical protein